MTRTAPTRLHAADGARRRRDAFRGRRQLVIIIPVQELEAWILADAQAVTKVSPGQPDDVQNPEAVVKPKEYLQRASRQANSRPRYAAPCTTRRWPHTSTSMRSQASALIPTSTGLRPQMIKGPPAPLGGLCCSNRTLPLCCPLSFQPHFHQDAPELSYQDGLAHRRPLQSARAIGETR